ncbi:hypothetical protein B0H17DRAFT_1088435 [Mycena rosella]|uniref:Uncharacterized protein n=1 Tax=Mycena rosella TaxID=1033263 RepID=A0AAD7CXB3_MYCRO|nr:hypothetical protein B0H17DRAFT_1088435 [Mycena rosella]
MFGVTCRRNGDVAGYDAEWSALFDALKAADAGADPGAPDDTGDDSTRKNGDKVELHPPIANPMRDLARVRRLLERKRAEAKHWKEKAVEVEMERDEQKEAMGRELDALRRQLELAQSSEVAISSPSSSQP